MTYSTLMVHLDGARPNAAVLDATAKLAKQHDAGVIGIAACTPAQLAGGDGYAASEFAVLERDIVIDELVGAKTDFQTHVGLQPHVLEWRSISTLDNIAHVIAAHARCADLLITSIGPWPNNRATHADTGDLIVSAGRPVLVVSDADGASDFKNVMVAWNDTRECRRAITAALPMLKAAECVTLVEISNDPISKRDAIKDVMHWLGRHKIAANRINSRMHGSKPETLSTIANDVKADLVVAGAYGHSRIREWAFGGVTRDLLLHERLSTLLSH